MELAHQIRFHIDNVLVHEILFVKDLLIREIESDFSMRSQSEFELEDVVVTVRQSYLQIRLDPLRFSNMRCRFLILLCLFEVNECVLLPFDDSLSDDSIALTKSFTHYYGP